MANDPFYEEAEIVMTSEPVSRLSAMFGDEDMDFVSTQRSSFGVRGENKSGGRTDPYWMSVATALLRAGLGRSMRRAGEGDGALTIRLPDKRVFLPPGAEIRLEDGTELRCFMKKGAVISEFPWADEGQCPEEPLPIEEASLTSEWARRERYHLAPRGTHRERSKNRLRKAVAPLPRGEANADGRAWGGEKVVTLEDITNPDVPQPPKEVEQAVTLLQILFPELVDAAQSVLDAQDALKIARKRNKK